MKRTEPSAKTALKPSPPPTSKLRNDYSLSVFSLSDGNGFFESYGISAGFDQGTASPASATRIV